MLELQVWFTELLEKNGIENNPSGLHEIIWKKLQEESPCQDTEQDFYRNFVVLFISRVKSNGQLTEFEKEALAQRRTPEQNLASTTQNVTETRTALPPSRATLQVSSKGDKVSPLTVWESKVANYLAQPRAIIISADISVKCPTCNNQFQVGLDEYNTHQVSCTHCKAELTI